MDQVGGLLCFTFKSGLYLKISCQFHTFSLQLEAQVTCGETEHTGNDNKSNRRTETFLKHPKCELMLSTLWYFRVDFFFVP